MIRNGLLPALGTGAPTPTHARPRDADAYAVYLKSLAISTDPGPNREAIAMLERASVIDPDYADTWVALADRYYNDGHYGGGGGAALRRSEAAARQALALDPNYMAAAVRLFTLQIEAGRLQDGYDAVKQLVAQHPDSGEAHFALSYVLRYGGLLEESARECEQAVSRDPTNPLFRTCAQPLMLLARYDRALDYARLESGTEWSMLVTRFIYQRMGRRTDARAQHDRLPPEYLRGMAPEMLYGLLSRCLAGAPPDQQGHVTDDDVRIFLTVREDPEPLYFWAGDLAYCGRHEAGLAASSRINPSKLLRVGDRNRPDVRRDSQQHRIRRAPCRRPGMPSPIPRACQSNSAYAVKEFIPPAAPRSDRRGRRGVRAGNRSPSR